VFKNGGRSSIGRALGCGPSGCGFKSHRPPRFSMEVRLYKKSDARNVLALYNKFNNTRLGIKTFSKLLKATKGRDFIFCGCVDGLVVGYLILKVDMDIENAGVKAEVTDFYVRQKFRGRGLGKKLLNAANVFSKKKRAKTLRVIMDENPSRAQRLYKSFGFRKMKEGATVLEKKLGTA
jgi:ribosomal protein S18 acetylase RimI-like enzyme